jgi:hypothetical protein
MIRQGSINKGVKRDTKIKEEGACTYMHRTKHVHGWVHPNRNDNRQMMFQ